MAAPGNVVGPAAGGRRRCWGRGPGTCGLGSTIALALLVGVLVAPIVEQPRAEAAATVERLSGVDRIGTAVAVARAAFEPGVALVVVAAADGFADALAAAPLAATAGGPTLLTSRDALDDRVRDELRRLGPARAVLLGGRATLSDQVEQEVREVVADVDRIAGADRYRTAAAVARELGPSGRAILARGDAFADALAAGPLAGYRQQPILLTLEDRIPEATLEVIDELGIGEITVAGGPAAIPDATLDQLPDDVEVTRRSGPTRFATAVALADAAVAAGGDAGLVTVVTGDAFPDALAAGPATVARGGVLLLVASTDLDRSAATRDRLLERRGVETRVTVIGGTAAVPGPVAEQVAWALEGPGDLQLGLQRVGPDFDQPLGVTAPPGDERLFVWERGGRISVMAADGSRRRTVADLGGRVLTGGERGLLGMAFHPDGSRVFLHYSTSGGSQDHLGVLAEHPFDGTTIAADGTRLLTVSQPASNHNGGALLFGPQGLLYLALGDGGGSDDQFGNGQDTSTPLGAVLRLDVSHAGAARAAPGNPFIGRAGDDRIWHYGLRNPYRITIDGPTATMLIADVGQDEWEEVDAVPLADGEHNFGWPITEGPECFQASTCDRSGLTRPIAYYDHGDGCSIIGGHVHRGSIGRLRGTYFYADFCTGIVRSLRYLDGEVVETHDWTDELSPGANVFSFGRDDAGETYLTTGSAVHRIVRR